MNWGTLFSVDFFVVGNSFYTFVRQFAMNGY